MQLKNNDELNGSHFVEEYIGGDGEDENICGSRHS